MHNDFVVGWRCCCQDQVQALATLRACMWCLGLIITIHCVDDINRMKRMNTLVVYSIPMLSYEDPIKSLVNECVQGKGQVVSKHIKLLSVHSAWR